MLVNKTVEFFLSEAAGWGLDEMPTTKSPGPGLGPGRDSDDQITGAGGRKINSKESAL